MSSGSSRGRGSKCAADRFQGFLARARHPFRASSSARADVPPESSPGGSSGGSIGSSVDRLDLGGSSGRASLDGPRKGMWQLVEVSGSLVPVSVPGEKGANASKVAQVITASFKIYIDRDGVTWKKVDQSYKNTYWEEFKKSFWWELPLTDERVYELWAKKASRRYVDWINQLKTDWPIDQPTEGRPDYMPVETWEHWCAYWNSDDARAKSDKMKRNRLSEPDGAGSGIAKHRGGSMSAVAYSYNLAREQGLSMGQTVVPTFRRMHYSQEEGAYTSAKAKRIAEEYEAQIAELSQHMPDGVEPTPDDHTSVFLGVAQDPAKHRVFGLGSLYQPEPTASTAHSPFPGAGSSSHPSYTQEELDSRITGVRDELRGEMRDMEAKMNQALEEQREHARQQQLFIERLIRERDTPPGWDS